MEKKTENGFTLYSFSTNGKAKSACGRNVASLTESGKSLRFSHEYENILTGKYMHVREDDLSGELYFVFNENRSGTPVTLQKADVKSKNSYPYIRSKDLHEFMLKKLEKTGTVRIKITENISKNKDVAVFKIIEIIQ